VLMMGNNPLEMAQVFDLIKKIPDIHTFTEIAFDLKSGLNLLAQFCPTFILIDDNLGRKELGRAVATFARAKQSKNTPITILKSSNYQEAFGGTVMNYVLKESLSAEALYQAMKNSLIASRTQIQLMRMYQKRKGQLKRLLS